jgi:hypothetical protein
MRPRNKRLDALRRTVDASLLLACVMDEEYPWFRDFGELSDDDQVARAVVLRALRGGEVEPLSMDVASEEFSVRSRLFEEALTAPVALHRVARAAISLEVARGGDVESPGFAARYGMPMHGSVAMHMLGYPAKWITPPYEHQGHRLLARMDALRARINTDNPLWFAKQAEAHVAFLATGVLPPDELRREAILAQVELDQLARHRRGQDVAEVLAMFDRAARAKGAERQSALVAIAEAARAGRLR